MKETIMKKSQPEQENEIKQEATKKMAQNIFSFIRESVGKKEKGWRKESVEEDLKNIYDKITKGSSGKALFDELDSMVSAKEEREYVNFLRIAAIQKINDTIGDGNYKGIKEHYGFNGAEIIEAITKKPGANKNNEELRQVYRLTSEDFLRYFTEKKKVIKIDDLKKYVNGGLKNAMEETTIKNYLKNAGIAENEVAAFVLHAETRKREEESDNAEQGKKERWEWTETAMRGMNTETIEITFDEMEKNLLKHSELEGSLYYKAMEIAIGKIKSEKAEKESVIREWVNRAIIEAA